MLSTAALKERLRGLPGAIRAGVTERVKSAPSRARALLPRGAVHWISVVLAWGILVAWFTGYCRGNAAPLFDPLIQPNDARTAIFPFHRYAPGNPLADDPIANEMLEYQPYAYRLLFRLTVPFVGVLAAAKLVQWLLILIVVWAGLVLATSRRAGLGAGLLFIFLFLHDAFFQSRVFGGLPRGFGFPTTALWLAGALAGRPGVRRTAAVIAALTYPTGLAMVLGAEGLYTLRSLGKPLWHTLFRRVKHYLLLVVACSLLLAPAVFLGMSDGGPVHTLEQAEREPAFESRLEILPFSRPGESFGRAFIAVFRQGGESPFPDFQKLFERYEWEVATIIAALLLAIPLLRLAPAPVPLGAFFVACLLVYAASRVYAFRLYSPERYYSVGMRVVALGLVASTLGFLLPRLARARRQPLRNFVCAGAIALTWFGLGNGVNEPRMGYAENYRSEGPLWRAISALPQSARIASHVLDGDSIPLFTARANNGGYETLQPWLTGSWARQKARTEDTLRAFYATDRRVVLDYAKKYAVSHLLLNRRRYGADYVRQSRSFEPFSSYAKSLLLGKQRTDLVLAEVPDEAVVFRRKNWILVDVEKLAQAW